MSSQKLCDACGFIQTYTKDERDSYVGWGHFYTQAKYDNDPRYYSIGFEHENVHDLCPTCSRQVLSLLTAFSKADP